MKAVVLWPCVPSSKPAACPAEAMRDVFLHSALQHQSLTDVTPKFRSSDHYLVNLALWSEMAERLLDVELFLSPKAH